jgi:hypothetical protein
VTFRPAYRTLVTPVVSLERAVLRVSSLSRKRRSLESGVRHTENECVCVCVCVRERGIAIESQRPETSGERAYLEIKHPRRFSRARTRQRVCAQVAARCCPSAARGRDARPTIVPAISARAAPTSSRELFFSRGARLNFASPFLSLRRHARPYRPLQPPRRRLRLSLKRLTPETHSPRITYFIYNYFYFPKIISNYKFIYQSLAF